MIATDDHSVPANHGDRPRFQASITEICERVQAEIMTPQQLRLLHPLRPHGPGEMLCNMINLAWTVWPLSSVHAAIIAYCHTLSAVLDPLSPGDLGLGSE